MTDDLVTWLRAQLDEDERVARVASLTPPVPSWRAPENLVYDADVPDDNSALNLAQSEWDEVAAHIARHDPARVLAEVDAKRRILDYFEYERIDVSLPGGPPETVPGKRPATAGPVLRLLALPYADRPGYREGWRP